METRKTKIAHEPRATFGNIRDSLRLIYQAQNPYTFFRAFSIGLFQFLLTGAVAELLERVVFPEVDILRPLAYAISSALLCELHLVFTCAIVSAEPVPFRSLLREPGQNRWKHLAIPVFWYGFSLSWMEILYYRSSSSSRPPHPLGKEERHRNLGRSSSVNSNYHACILLAGSPTAIH